VIKIPRKC